MDYLQDLIDKFKAAFYTDDYTTLTSLIDEIDELESQNAEYRLIIQNTPEISILRKDMQALSDVLVYLYENSDWTTVKCENGISIYSRSSEDDLFVKCEMTIEAPIFQVLALISEIDLLPTW